jgi:protein transport protein HofC
MTTAHTSTTDAPAPVESARSGFGLRHLMYAIFWIALLIAAIREFGWALLFFGLIMVPPALVAGAFVLLVRWRSTQQDALLRVMAIATERRMPLSPGIEAFADLCGGGYRRKAMALAYLLDAGVPLPQALASIPGILPQPSVVLACVGWNDGALGVALREAVAAGEIRRTYRGTVTPKLAYLAAVLLALQTIVGFVLYFIAPKFEAIFMDFGIDLPGPTKFVITAGHWIVRSGCIGLLVVAELAILAYLPFAYFGWVTWELPVIDRLLRKRDAAAIMRSLAIGVDSGKPLSSGIGLLAGFYPRTWVRRRLQRVFFQVESGAPWYESLRRHGLIRRGDAAVLESAQRAGNLSWALRAMAEGNDRSLGYRLQAFTQALFPVVVVALGVVVGTIVVAYFYPLVALIERLA